MLKDSNLAICGWGQFGKRGSNNEDHNSENIMIDLTKNNGTKE